MGKVERCVLTDVQISRDGFTGFKAEVTVWDVSKKDWGTYDHHGVAWPKPPPQYHFMQRADPTLIRMLREGIRLSPIGDEPKVPDAFRLTYSGNKYEGFRIIGLLNLTTGETWGSLIPKEATYGPTLD